MRLLIYTDSRGQHTPRGEPVHDVFATRLAKRPNVEATVLLCPMKWTTTIDFLDVLKTYDPRDFDHTILYTGIVDWSPRPAASAVNDLYDNPAPLNLDNLGLNTREYARKVINNKKASFDRVFGGAAMRAHFSRDLGVAYEGQATNNMYSLEMAERYLLPQLKAIDNLLFINSNRFIPGWEGDYTRGRPANIGITEEFSDLFRRELGADKVIDLLQWDEAAVRVLTCDNLHLSKAGSDWIYDALSDRISGGTRAKTRSGKDGTTMKVETFSLPPKRSEQKNDSILIIGNGPSARKLAEFGFDRLPKTLDTFGMGAAYRYFEEINWWPTYYAWCDVKVVHSHREAFAALIDNPKVTTKELFFSLPISTNQRFTQVPHGSTGDFCFRKAAELGYKNIYLIGIEGDYVEELAESRPLTEKEYYTLGFDELYPLFEHLSPDPKAAMSLYRDNLRIIERTPERNPNYFFEGYQRAGDVYSLPRAQTHRNSWRNSVLAASHANVVNLSAESKIDYFRKVDWETFAGFAADFSIHRDIFAPNGRAVETPVRLSASERASALQRAGLGPNEKLATLIIGVRFPKENNSRVSNLRVLLDWIDCYYGDLFDVLLVEQDTSSHIKLISDRMRPYVRHKFIYNPSAFNRGWGYNVAVRHFTKSKVVGLLDTDVLTGANFVQEIVDCHSRYKAVSPYANVYFTNDDEAARVSLTFDFDHLRDATRITKPTTISGGIVIVRRDTFLEVAGFEQYIEYAGEDRSLDVTLYNHCAPSEVRAAPYTYVHLNHPTGTEARPRAKELFAHLRAEYGCRHDPSLTVLDDIHKNCQHVAKEKTLENTQKRLTVFGDPNLYRSGHTLAINGVYTDADRAAPSAPRATTTASPEPTVNPDLIFPPAFRSLDTYAARELYEAPEPDSAKLAGLFNQFKGKRCFIIGNGPSLNKHDLTLLKDEYTFAVNSIYYKTAETGFRPTFFVVEDDAVMRENVEPIRAYEAPYKFFPTNYKSLHPPGKNVYFFRANRGFYEKSSPNYCVPRFSTDASKVLYCGQSVTYINLQLAFFMGFTEVYLLGMDFDYVIPTSHERKGDLIVSTTDDPNHFHKDYFGKGKTWKDPKLERVGLNYRQAKLSYEAVGRRIYNATIGGKLEIFDRVDYNRLLRDGVKKVVPSLELQPARTLAPAPVAPTPSSPPEPTMSETPAYDTIAATPAEHENRVFYAGFGERLREKSPGAFHTLRFVRRTLAGLWRRRKLVVPALLALAALPLLTLVPAFAEYRPHIWGIAAFLTAMAVIAYVAMRLYVAMGHQIAGLEAATRRFEELKEATDRIGDGVAYMRERSRALKAEDQKLRKDFDKRVGSVRGDVEKVWNELSSLRSEFASRGTVSRPMIQAEIQTLMAEIGGQNAALRNEVLARVEEITAEADARQEELNDQAKAVRADFAQRLEELKLKLKEQIAATQTSTSEQLAASQKLQAQTKEQLAGVRTELTKEVQALKLNAEMVGKQSEVVRAEVAKDLETLKAEIAKRELALEQRIKAAGDTMQKAFTVDRANVSRLRERVAASERQLGRVKYTDTPSTLVFFGHHKCGSRFFRNEIFAMAAEVLGARIRKYEVKHPPFHYSMSDELDLVNTDLEGLGKDGRDVVLFSNATMRTLDRVRRKGGEDWRGLRIIRDPRQVLVSDYLHHKNGHHTEWNGWVWDQLVHDKPLLNELPQEQGLLLELDSISRQIIETQVLAPFDDPRVMTLKIEDFARDPKAYLQRISEFLRIPDISGIDFSRTAANPESGPWQGFFTSKLRQVFKERYGQALIDMGYAEDFDW